MKTQNNKNKHSHQDYYYLNKESDQFYDRGFSNVDFDGNLRENKSDIYKHINRNYKVNENTSILEIGCFIGDLLYEFKKNYNCNVQGVEPSTKACKFSKDRFGLELENTIYIESLIFSNKKSNHQIFDIVICDDVLSWMSRDSILPVLASIDWILKDNGIIYLRDFTPSYPFRFKNHHCPEQQIFNYKMRDGHKTILKETGKYVEIFSYQRLDSKYQNIKTSKTDSALWGDSILKKLKENLFIEDKLM